MIKEKKNVNYLMISGALLYYNMKFIQHLSLIHCHALLWIKIHLIYVALSLSSQAWLILILKHSCAFFKSLERWGSYSTALQFSETKALFPVNIIQGFSLWRTADKTKKETMIGGRSAQEGEGWNVKSNLLCPMYKLIMCYI